MFEGDISTITPLGLVFTLVMGVLMYVLPRRYAPIPMIMAGCYITFGQMLYVGGLHFSVMRIMILVGWLRVITRREFKELQFNRIDKALLVWAFASVIMYNIQWQTYDAFINRLGFLYNALGLYFLFRCLIRNLDEVMHAIKMLAFIMLPFALLMLYEKITGLQPILGIRRRPGIHSRQRRTPTMPGPFQASDLGWHLGRNPDAVFCGLVVRQRRTAICTDRVGICNDYHNHRRIERSSDGFCIRLDCPGFVADEKQDAHYKVGRVVFAAIYAGNHESAGMVSYRTVKRSRWRYGMASFRINRSGDIAHRRMVASGLTLYSSLDAICNA